MRSRSVAYGQSRSGSERASQSQIPPSASTEELGVDFF